MCPLGRSRDRSRARAGGGALPWTPAALAPFAWYRADDLAASPVSAWNDRTTNAKNLAQGTGANQPTWQASLAALGNRAVVTTTATQQVKAATASDWTFLHSGAGGTIVLIGRATTTGALCWLGGTLGASAVSLGCSVLKTAANTARFIVGNNVASVVDFTTAATLPTTGLVIVGRYGTSASPKADLRFSRASQGTSGELASPSASAPSGALTVNGLATAATTGAAADWAEVIVCNRVITDAECAAVEAYAAGRYGI